MADQCDLVEEAVTATTATTPRIAVALSDSMVAGDAASYAIGVLVVATSLLSTTAIDAFGTNVIDTVAIATPTAQGGLFGNRISDSASLAAVVAQIMSNTISDGSAIGTAVSIKIGDTATTAAVVSTTIQQALHAITLLADAASLDGFAPAYMSNYASNSVVATTAVAHAAHAIVNISDAAAIGTTALQTAHFIQLVTNPALLATLHVDRNAALSVIIDQAYLASETDRPAGGAWTALAETWGMSRYTGMPYNSIAVVNGVTIVAGDDGIFALSGDTDAGAQISAYVDSGIMPVNDRLKRPRYAYIGYTADGALALDVTGAASGVATTYSHVFQNRVADWMTPNKVPLARALRSGYYQFRLKNQAGCDFLLNELRIILNESSRSV